jgi:hypothetical protein
MRIKNKSLNRFKPTQAFILRKRQRSAKNPKYRSDFVPAQSDLYLGFFMARLATWAIENCPVHCF